MKIDAVIRGSKIQLIVNGEGTFEEAQALTRRALAELEATLGPGLVLEGAIEQHRPEIPHAHVAQRATQEQSR